MKQLFFLSLACGSLLLPAQSPLTDFATVEQDIRDYLQRQQRSGLSLAVAVSREGRSLYDRQFGPPGGLVYPIASVTKPITSTAILQLAAAGQVDLDAPARNYLARDTEYPDPAWEQITVRHLLNHTAGLGMYYRVLYRDEHTEVPSIAALIERHGFLFSAPGERFEYANLGYAVLGEIVERVSGMPFDVYVHDRIFAPLGGKATGLYDDRAPTGTYAPLFGIANDSLPYVYTDTPGAGNLYATAPELAAFGAAHLSANRLQIGRSVVERAAADRRTDVFTNPCQPYHLGWFYQRDDGGRVNYLWHDGGLDGAHATLRLYPEEDLVIAVTTNTTFTVGAADSVAAILQTALTDVPLAQNCPVEEGQPFAVDSSWHGAWTGYIRTATDSLDLQLTFREDGAIVAGFTAPQSAFIFSGNQPLPLRTVVDLISGTNEHFYAWLPLGAIDDPAVRDAFHVVQLDLRRRENKLSGAAKAFTANTGREGFGIAYPVVLTREQ